MCSEPRAPCATPAHTGTRRLLCRGQHPRPGESKHVRRGSNRPVSQEKNVAKPDPGGRGPHSHYHPESRRPLKSAGKPLTAPVPVAAQHPREPGWGAGQACPMGGGRCRCGIRAHPGRGAPVSRSLIHCRRADSWGLWGPPGLPRLPRRSRLRADPATTSSGPKLCSCVSPGPHHMPGPQMARDQLWSWHGARGALRGTPSCGRPKTEAPRFLAPRGMSLSPGALPLLAEGGVDRP